MDRDRLDRNEGDGEEMGRSVPGRWEHRGNHRPSHDSGHHPPPRTARTWESNHHDNHDNSANYGETLSKISIAGPACSGAEEHQEVKGRLYRWFQGRRAA